MEKNNEVFINDMSYRNDKMYLILRGHLYIELELNTLLDNCLPHPEELELNKMTFYNKVKLAKALNLIDDLTKNVLLQFNEIRNNYAHNLNYQLGYKAVRDLKINLSKITGFEIYKEKFVIEDKEGLAVDLKACIVGARVLLKHKSITVNKMVPKYSKLKET
ncbi:hypothetical protein QUF56_09445 [Ureibacillus composti]|nr:hypothetical protein [Ureibacillus composti]